MKKLIALLSMLFFFSLWKEISYSTLNIHHKILEPFTCPGESSCIAPGGIIAVCVSVHSPLLLQTPQNQSCSFASSAPAP